MNLLTKGSVVFYLAAVFAAGLVAGGVAGFSLGQRRAFAPPPRPPEMAAHMCDDLRGRLHLTPEQVRQIEPILVQTAADLESIHAAMGARMAEIFQKSNQHIAQFLTPEQKVWLQEMDRERQRFMHRGPPHGPRGGRPGPESPDGRPPRPDSSPPPR